MNALPAPDPLLQSLGRLPAAPANPGHDARVRDGCHAVLAESRRRPSSRVRLVRRPIETFIVGAFGLVYLVAILYNAAQVYR